MKAYSRDIRESIVRAIEKGEPRREVARLFHVSVSTVRRYFMQWREQGSLQPKPIPGRPPKKLGCLEAGLQSQLEELPDATLQEHCDYWEAREGIKVSPTTMSRVMQRLGWTRKKLSGQ